jgi:hypothetical protein
MASQREPVSRLTIEISPGELLDKISILEIKAERIDAPEKLTNIRHELDLYQATARDGIPASDDLAALNRELKAANEALWEIEDDIRDCEGRGDFGDRFVELARNVYRTNDRRADIKRRINLLCGSSIIEEKSYTKY